MRPSSRARRMVSVRCDHNESKSSRETALPWTVGWSPVRNSPSARSTFPTPDMTDWSSTRAPIMRGLPATAAKALSGLASWRSGSGPSLLTILSRPSGPTSSHAKGATRSTPASGPSSRSRAWARGGVSGRTGRNLPCRPRWTCRTSLPSHQKNKCFPYASTRSSRRPSRCRAPARKRFWGELTRTEAPANVLSWSRAYRWIR